MTMIKICGLRSMDDIAAVNEFKPDYIGFIFVANRKRYIEPQKAHELKEKLNKDIKVVGVFVDEDIKHISDIANSNTCDIIQLHGNEDNDYIESLRKLTDKPLIKAIRVDSEADVKRACECKADMVLFDCGAGGTGKKFDWSLIENFDKPFFLAGGIGSDNVIEAMNFLHPTGVDVSSSVETDGKKDPGKVERFITLVRKEDIKND